MFNDQDLKLFKERNVTVEQIEAQLNAFKTGFPYLKIVSAATVDNGIMKLSAEEEAHYVSVWNQYLEGDAEILKFVPASGAASRMFKDLFSFLDSESATPDNDFMKKFFGNIHNFAFYGDLNKAVEAKCGVGIDALMERGEYKPIVACLLKSDGLNYGSLPKALLEFHKIGGEIHTALAEHLEEGAQYASNKENKVNVHFTVSGEHRALFEKEIEKLKPEFSKAYGVSYEIGMSEQKASTDTIAVNMDNTPFREDGKLLFRPGGHGALIENLNDVDANVVFIKNIDNVVPKTLRETTVKYKKIIGGILVDVQKKIAEYLQLLESGNYNHDQVLEIVRFVQRTLCVRNENTKNMEDSELVLYLKGKLNRPIRVCGVVRNEGEPGGGPYIAYNQDGSMSLQILESTQIDKNNAEAVKLMKEATHFNPVDLVCYIKNYKGEKFDLPKYVDKNTGFISEKSKSGHEIKALELPGLWNGAMSDWNTIFVEVPIETFNPVKTVNDLLRPAHQG